MFAIYLAVHATSMGSEWCMLQRVRFQQNEDLCSTGKHILDVKNVSGIEWSFMLNRQLHIIEECVWDRMEFYVEHIIKF